MIKPNDLVQIVPLAQPVGKVLRVTDAGNVVILWPSGKIETYKPNQLEMVVSYETLQRLDI